MANDKKRYRIQFVMTEKDFAVIERGRTEGGAVSDKQVVDRAIALYDLYLRYRKKGVQLGTFKDGLFTAVEIL